MHGLLRHALGATAFLMMLGAAGSGQAFVDLLLAGGCQGTDVCANGGSGSADGNVDPGETADFEVNLRNIGDEDATNVVVTVVPLTLGVTMLADTTMLGTVPAGGGGSGMTPIQYAVADTVACSTPLMFRIEIRSDQQDKDESCTVVIPMACTPCLSSANLVLAGCEPVTDTCALGAGDANTFVDPGESITLRLGADNTGGSDATNVVATVTTTTPGVTLTQDTTNLGDIAAGSGAVGMELIEFDLDLSVACGTDIVLDVSFASDQGPFSDVCSVSVPATCVPCTMGPVLTLTDCGPSDACAFGGPGDGDGLIDPGESITVELGVTNSGGSDATTVTATVTSPTAGVTITQGSAAFGTLMPGDSMRGDMNIVFDISPSVACGTLVQLDVLIQSDQVDAPETCSLMVEADCRPCTDQPVLVLQSCDTQDSCAAGGATDGNGTIEPGEDGALRVGLENLSGVDATNVVAVVSTLTPGVTIVQDTANFGTIPGFSPGMTMDTVDYTVDETVPCDTEIVFDVQVTSDSGMQAETCSIFIPPACAVCDVMPSGFVFDLTGQTVVSDSCALGGPGDANGMVDPGETVTLTIDVSNLGPGDATAATATLVSLTPGVSVTQASATLGDLAAFASATSDPAFAFTTDAALTSCADQLLFRVDFDAAEGAPPAEMIDSLFIPLPCDPCTASSDFTLTHVASAIVDDSCAFGGPGDVDGNADPGETVQFDVVVRNEGPDDVTGVALTLSAVTPGLTVTQAAASVGDLTAGAMASSATPFEFSIDAAVVGCGDLLEFDLAYSANEGSSPTERVDDLSVPMPCNVCEPAGGYAAVHVSSAIVSDSCADGGPGDMDGNADPGETVQFTVDVMNEGPGDASNLTLSITALTPGVTVLTANAPVGSLASGATATSMAPFEIRIDSMSRSCGDALSFVLSFSADEGDGAPDTIDDLSIPMPCNVCMSVLPDPPGEVPDVQVTCSGGDLMIQWTGATDADTHRVYRGTLASLDPAGMPYDHACIAGDLMPPLENLVPGGCDAPGNVYFLVVGANAAGEGSYGLDDMTGDGVGDNERPVGTGPCP